MKTTDGAAERIKFPMDRAKDVTRVAIRLDPPTFLVEFTVSVDYGSGSDDGDDGRKREEQGGGRRRRPMAKRKTYHRRIHIHGIDRRHRDREGKSPPTTAPTTKKDGRASSSNRSGRVAKALVRRHPDLLDKVPFEQVLRLVRKIVDHHVRRGKDDTNGDSEPGTKVAGKEGRHDGKEGNAERGENEVQRRHLTNNLDRGFPPIKELFVPSLCVPSGTGKSGGNGSATANNVDESTVSSPRNDLPSGPLVATEDCSRGMLHMQATKECDHATDGSLIEAENGNVQGFENTPSDQIPKNESTFSSTKKSSTAGREDSVVSKDDGPNALQKMSASPRTKKLSPREKSMSSYATEEKEKAGGKDDRSDERGENTSFDRCSLLELDSSSLKSLSNCSRVSHGDQDAQLPVEASCLYNPSSMEKFGLFNEGNSLDDEVVSFTSKSNADGNRSNARYHKAASRNFENHEAETSEKNIDGGKKDANARSAEERPSRPFLSQRPTENDVVSSSLKDSSSTESDSVHDSKGERFKSAESESSQPIPHQVVPLGMSKMSKVDAKQDGSSTEHPINDVFGTDPTKIPSTSTSRGDSENSDYYDSDDSFEDDSIDRSERRSICSSKEELDEEIEEELSVLSSVNSSAKLRTKDDVGVFSTTMLPDVDPIEAISKTEEMAAYGDLNTVCEEDLQNAKRGMDSVFEEKRLQPGDNDFMFDKRIDFDEPELESSWD